MDDRSWILALSLFAHPCFGSQAGGERELEVRSADGRHLARIATAEDGRRTVHVQTNENGLPTRSWSAPFPPPAEDERQLLLDDSTGAALFVHLRPFLAGDFVAPVSIHGLSPAVAGGELRAWSASELHLAPAEFSELPPGRRWLSESADAVRVWSVAQPWGDELGLSLDLADGRSVELDLWTGAARGVASDARPRALSWSPEAVELEQPDSPYVHELECAELASAGRPFELLLRGAFPTPGFALEGFALHGRRVEPAARFGAGPSEIELSLEPLARRPPEGTRVLAVLDPFEQRVVLADLPPGNYSLRVFSRSDRELGARRLRVLEPGLVAALHATGGIAGIDRRTTVFADGWVERGGTRPLPRGPAQSRMEPEQLTAFRDLLPALPKSSFTEHFGAGADLMAYELVWLDGDSVRCARVDDMTAKDALRDMIRLLQGL